MIVLNKKQLLAPSARVRAFGANSSSSRFLLIPLRSAIYISKVGPGALRAPVLIDYIASRHSIHSQFLFLRFQFPDLAGLKKWKVIVVWFANNHSFPTIISFHQIWPDSNSKNDSISKHTVHTARCTPLPISVGTRKHSHGTEKVQASADHRGAGGETLTVCLGMKSFQLKTQNSNSKDDSF